MYQDSGSVTTDRSPSFLIKTSEEMEKHFLQRVINVYMKNNLEMFREIKEITPIKWAIVALNRSPVDFSHFP